MAQFWAHPDVVVEGYNVTFKTSPQKDAANTRRDADAAVVEDRFLDIALATDAQLLTDLRVLPAGRRDGPRSRVNEIDVKVSPDEAAVLLVEDEDGLLSWRYPDDANMAERVRRRGAGAVATKLRFTLAEQPTATGSGRRGWIGVIAEKLAEPVRIAVLRFLVARTLDAAVRRIEGDMRTGLVDMSGADVAGWVPAASVPAARRDEPLRVLLMVHGTFSSTAGSFGKLAKTPEWEAVKTRYDLILGQDHRTLAESPEDNAHQIADSLHGLALPAGTVVDAVAFSRGGLVLRAFAEHVAPQRLPELTFGKMIFVGCTNAGTLLAEPENWETFVNVYTNLVAGTAKLGLDLLGASVAAPWVSYAIKTLGRFVQMLSQVAISERRLPGLAAMEPDGDLVTFLNESTALAVGTPAYFVVASDFEPKGKMAEMLRSAVLLAADRFADGLMKEGNDLVVHTASMGSFGAARLASEQRAIDVGERVFHTAYFASATTRQAMANWLLVDNEIYEAVPTGEVDCLVAVPCSAPTDIFEAFPAEEGEERKEAAVPGGTRRGASGNLPAQPYEQIAGIADAAERYVAAEMEPFPRLERKANLYVTVSPKLFEVGDHAAAAAMLEPVALDRSQPLTIQVMAMRNCTIAGDAQAVVDLAADEESICKFVVRGIQSGEAEVLVEARQGMSNGAGGAIMASFLLKPIFISMNERAERVVQTLSPQSRTRPQAILRIYEFIDSGQNIVLRFDLGSEDPAIAVLEDIRLPSRFPLAEFSAGILASLDDAYKLSDNVYDSFLADFIDRARVRTTELIPEKVRKALWENRDAIAEVQVVSQEAFVPWELMCLFEPGSAKAGERPQFLAEWGLTRWLHNVPIYRKPIDLKTGGRFHVVPDYEGDRDLYLKSAQQERAMLETKLGSRAIPATAKDLREFLSGSASKDAALIHFACHGEAIQGPTMAADLILRRMAKADGSRVEERLSWQTIKAHADFGKERRPLVFINACQTGKPGASIAGIAGFADAFLRPMHGTGAGAFIGALWSVDDALATVFSQTIYDELLGGKPLNEAVKTARIAAQANSDFTWLAYCVYCG